MRAWLTRDPGLVFTKLASQLTLAKIAELAVIPVIFVVMTLISYCCALAVAKLLGLKKRARNFVIAMVCLPILRGACW